MVHQIEKMQVKGGLRIIATGTVNFLDIWDGGNDSGLNVADAAFNDTASNYIPLHPAIKALSLHQIEIGYVDTAAVNDLANVHLFSGASATDQLQSEKWIWSSGAVIETPATAAGHQWLLDPPRKITLDTAGRLYFITEWTTAAISCAAGEWFFIKVYGEEDEGT